MPARKGTCVSGAHAPMLVGDVPCDRTYASLIQTDGYQEDRPDTDGKLEHRSQPGGTS